jgi:hypothetical protein
MGKIEGRDRRLTDIGINVAGQAPEPRLDRVHALRDHCEVAALDHLLNEAQFLRCNIGIGVPHRHCRRNIGLTNMIGTKLLERHVRVGGFVRRIAVEHHRCFVGHDFFEDASN